jgi:CRP/FNR family transcriptional regulator, cyclic AMP receptor protein
MRKALHLLGILDDVDIDWLASNGILRHVSAGTTLIHEKKPIDSLYLLLEGQLSITVGGTAGKQIATLFPGEIVGEISFVDTRPPSASVMAIQDSQLLALARDALSDKLAKDQAFAARFYRAIATFLADRLYVTVGRYGYGSAQQDVDIDELPDSAMDEIDLATVRVDKLIKRLRSNDRSRDASWLQ